MSYATLDDVKAELKATTTNVANERYILQSLRQISRRIHNIAGFDFEPYFETRHFSSNASTINSGLGLFTLNDYLLELDSLTSDGVAKTLDTDFYAYPRNTIGPIRSLRIADTCSDVWYPCGDSIFDTIVISGWWGYKERYATEGWLLSNETVPVGGISASATTFTATDVDGEDTFGYIPRISPGNLLRIDDEMTLVTATNTSTSLVTIQRGARGTTAAAHSAATTIKVWNVEEPIRRAATRAAAYNYARKGAFETAQITDLGTVTYPADFPAEVRAALQAYAYG